MIHQRQLILADLIERRRIMAEAKELQGRLEQLTKLRKSYAAKVIAERYAAAVRQVNFLASKLERDHAEV